MTQGRTMKGAPRGGTKIPRKDMYFSPFHYRIPDPHFFHPISVTSRHRQVEKQIGEPFFLLLRFMANNNKLSFPAQSVRGLVIGSTTPRGEKVPPLGRGQILD